MRSSEFPRNARVEANDGDLGRVRHVVVDPATQTVTDVVVEDDGRQWLISASDVAAIEGKRIRLDGELSRFRSAAFRAEEFEPLNGPGNGAKGAALQRRPKRLELKEEVLRVSKTEEQAGVVRVSKRVTERMETLSIPLWEERLVIEVVPGSGTARIGDRELHEGESIELLLREERVALSKEVVAREDVIIRTEMDEREEHFEEMVRREELVIEEEGGLVVEPANADWRTAAAFANDAR
jgi:uncharacterized protein (TIGR02271 family)